ncbi:MAG: hypothetical protein QM704_21255 [Anaeromyxobacteraceae bacterium]
MLRQAWAIISLLLCSACVPVDAALVDGTRPCSPEEALAAGLNDGRAGREADLAFATRCDPAAGPAARAGYLDGYREGLAARAAEGSQGRGFTCEVTPFTKTYSGAAATEARAAALARERCLARESELFCRDVTCRVGG